MLHALRAGQGAREVWWFHGVRNRAEHAFADEVTALLTALPGARGRVWYSRPDPGDRPGVDYDEAGRVTADGLAAAGLPDGCEIYLCGPAAFMAALQADLAARGVAAGRVHTEAFGAEAAINPGVVGGPARPPHPPAGDPGSGPVVSFARTGLNVPWDDRFASVLELAEACDLPVRWACRTGVCHTCETGLLDGTVAYDPEPLDPPGDGNLLVCCARPRTPLAVDL